MRCLIYILITWAGIWVSVADASEVLLGTVVAIDRGQGRITLKTIDAAGGGQGQAGSESIVITIAPGKIPGNLSAGDTVRVWGESSGNGAFKADSIRKRGSGGSGSDPTGVRSRLRQGGGQGNGQGAGGRQSGKR
jgi:hypothetical protein